MKAEDYNPLEAAAIAYQQLPADFRAALTQDDVLYILYLEFQFHSQFADHPEALQAQAHEEPGDRMERMMIFIYERAASQGSRYTIEQIAHVLKGEDLYLRQIGLIEP